VPSLPEVVQRLRGSSSGVDIDTEEGRSFLQERVAFFNKVTFLISGTFFLASLAVGRDYTVSQGGRVDWRPGALHLATLLVSLAAWQVCRRPLRLGTRALLLIDAASLFFPLLGFSLQVPTAPPVLTGQIAYMLVLILTNMAILRAVLVPSSAWHTTRVTVLAAIPVALGLVALGPPPGLPARVANVNWIWSALWVACAVVVATLASRVIYGLREEVQKAQRLGQYTLEEKLGEGGMGAVYRARHALLRRPTAIKLLPPEKAGHVALERFEREVQLTASLSHPNTVSVFDYGRTPDGIFYYAMEYLDGTDLETLAREDGPQPEGRVVHVLEQVAASLVEAHGIGLIHRDIKPENVILCERGGVPDVAKVLDFGLVKDLERGSSLTQADLVQGTPLYLSPEAITAPDRVGPGSDIYAVGAVAYYLLTGRHVFEGATVVEVCSHHLHTAPVPPSQRLARSVHPGLEELILACLAKDPAARPASAAELRDRLRALSGLEAWREETAREWWARWRARPRQPSAPATAARPPASRTVSVALGDRGAPPAR
jgi:predicted Ser/Thr protein kinase